MICLTKTLLILGIVGPVTAGIFEKKFLVCIEDISQTNLQLSSTNHELNKTVIAQRNMMTNLTGMVEELKMTVEVLNTTNANLKATIQEMNSTLLMVQTMQNGKVS